MFSDNHQQLQSGNESDDRDGNTSEDSGSRYGDSGDSKNALVKACLELMEDSPPPSLAPQSLEEHIE